MRPPLLRFILAVSLVPILLAVARPAAPPPLQRLRLDAVGDRLPRDAITRFGTARFRDDEFFRTVALSPDGKLLAVSGSQAIRLLDAATGREVRRITGQRPVVGLGAITFSPDGKLLALADFMNIVVCDVGKGSVLAQFPSSGRAGQASLSFSGDGKLLAVGGRGFREKLSVTVWDVPAKVEKKKFDMAHDREVHAVLSPDGKVLAGWGHNLQRREESVVQFWDLATGKERFTLKPDGFALQHVVFSPDGKQLVTVESGLPVSIREAATGKVIRQFVTCGNLSVVAYSPDGKLLATGTANGTVQLWDPISGMRVGQCKAPPQTQLSSVAFQAGNKVLAAGFSHQMLRLWDVPSGRERTPAIGHLAAVSALAFSRDGKTLLSAGSDGMRVHALATGNEIRWIEPPVDELGRRLRGRVNRAGVYLSPDGRYVLWAGQLRGGLAVVELASGEEIADLPTFSSPFGGTVAFASRGSGIVSLSMDMAGRNRQATAHVWDPATGLLRQKIKVSSTAFEWVLALSPDGKLFVVASTQRRTRHYGKNRPLGRGDRQGAGPLAHRHGRRHDLFSRRQSTCHQ